MNVTTDEFLALSQGLSDRDVKIAELTQLVSFQAEQLAEKERENAWLREEVERQMEETTLSVKLKVDTPFVLGLVLAHIFNRWHKEGVSFDELKLNMKENTLLLRICKYPDMNRMKVECVECNERNS